MLGLACSKIQEFLCFQVSQATKITKELNPFCKSFGISRRPFLHQLENLVSDIEGTRVGRCRAWKTENQICLVKTQPTRMCCMVSPPDHRKDKPPSEQASFSKSDCLPTSIADSQPNEELAPEWSPTLPNLFPWCKFDGPNKESSIR
jgi:hypothetical protein